MSQNISQLYTASPATSMQANDLLYFGRSPYNTADDFAIKWSDLQTSITAVGTVTTGTWAASIITGTYGGTGVNNGSKLITIGGNLTFSGAFPFAGTLTGSTTVTFPTNGLLALAGVNNDITSMTGLTGSLKAPTSISDVNGNNVLAFGHVSNAVNYFTMTNSATGNVLSLNSTGGDATVGINIVPAGAGVLTLLSQALTQPFTIYNGTASQHATEFTFPNTSALRVVTFPDASGTIAYTSSLPTPAALTSTNDTNVTITLGGTPATALLQATSLTMGWTGVLSGSRGGTGVNNGASTLTYGGNTSFSGAFTFTGTVTANTAVTFPASGTLATTSQLPTPAALTSSNDTNVTLTLGGTPTTALLQATSLTMGWSGQLSLARGGTNSSLTASNGGIIYSTASSMAVLSGTATANQVLLSGSSIAPTWSTATYPSTTTINQLLYSSSNNTISGISTVNSSGLLTNSSGVPAWVAYTGTGSPVLATSPTLVTPILGVATATSIAFNPTTSGLIGTTVGDSASAGIVGEFGSSIVLQSSPVSISTVTPIDLTSITLAAGDYDLWGNIGFGGNALTTFSYGDGWINSVSATLPAAELYNTAVFPTSPAVFATNFVNFSVPMRRFSFASPTTFYLSVQASFAVNTAYAFGGIRWRRRR